MAMTMIRVPNTIAKTPPHISGANVKLCKNSQTIDELQTDDFGDFKFDKLPANSGEYEIEIEYKSIKKSIKLNLNDSLFLGNIYI